MRTESRRYALGGRAGWIRLGVVVWLVLVVEFVGQSVIAHGAITTQAGQPLRFDHVVIVIEENKSFSDIIGNTSDAPYINQLASLGASFIDAHGEMHPSQQNYLALFSGSTQEGPTVVGDNCIKPGSLPGPTLATLLRAKQLSDGEHMKQLSFAGFADHNPNNLTHCYVTPKDAKKDLNAGQSWVVESPGDLYVSKHVPWLDFNDPQMTKEENLSLDDFKKYDFTNLNANYPDFPTISIVIPNNQENMHPANFKGDVSWSKGLQAGDNWLAKNMVSYVKWAKFHNSLFILTWDEDSSPQSCSPPAPASACPTTHPMKYPDGQHVGTTPEDNQIPTIFVGAHVKPGKYDEWINHYNILRTLEDMYELDYLGVSASEQPITDVWS